MAIERKTYTHDMKLEEPEGADQAPETVEVPVSMLGGQPVSPGDVIRLEVVANNEDAGTVTAKYAESKPMTGGIDEAASKFTEEPSE